ncbi:hypothetical protein Sango_0648600 [Sesamum angolense]|uniref:Transposase MuDR plant domain-containing protein n=1 Tax=Sesamum angolense TaxID=2727404 RepID=A0AAE1X749_9LAMI|nr:hypothetical protein Sango_0648600 [Sesamum angolense]
MPKSLSLVTRCVVDLPLGHTRILLGFYHGLALRNYRHSKFDLFVEIVDIVVGDEGEDTEDSESGDKKSKVVEMEMDMGTMMRMMAYAFREFVLQEGFRIKRYRNETQRVTVGCDVKECSWRIHDSPLGDGVTFQIKKYSSVHMCIRPDNTKETSAKWMA